MPVGNAAATIGMDPFTVHAILLAKLFLCKRDTKLVLPDRIDIGFALRHAIKLQTVHQEGILSFPLRHDQMKKLSCNCALTTALTTLWIPVELEAARN